MKLGVTNLLVLLAATASTVTWGQTIVPVDSPIGDPNFGILSPSGDTVPLNVPMNFTFNPVNTFGADYINVYLVGGFELGLPGPHAAIAGTQLITELKPSSDPNGPAYHVMLDWAPWRQILPNGRMYTLWVEEKFNAGHPSTHPQGVRNDVSYWRKSFVLTVS
ncbi:hypothetical protein Moror_14484 [Moniliophthora roreri MCA 2997]|uniref:Uncharacterized protein n=2 Tax=Moniliophthora roreri TaxID=221103 RepID=V2WNR1_MONRO|nr:hypothetical protein Moror_14484 [Moniliophthora roreri MCA 2997]KAI3596447.1 hypothetical protein WG66_003208 [Moniliophthora roreri]